MIADALLGFLTVMLDWCFALVPSMIGFITLPEGPAVPCCGNMGPSDNVFGMLAGWAAKYNNFLPVQESFALLTFVFGFILWERAWRIVRFLISVVRGAGVS